MPSLGLSYCLFAIVSKGPRGISHWGMYWLFGGAVKRGKIQWRCIFLASPRHSVTLMLLSQFSWIADKVSINLTGEGNSFRWLLYYTSNVYIHRTDGLHTDTTWTFARTGSRTDGQHMRATTCAPCRCLCVLPELIQPAGRVGWLLARCGRTGLTWHGRCWAVLLGVFSLAGHLQPSEKSVAAPALTCLWGSQQA